MKSHLIMNGVCVTWRGWVDLERLDGVGCLEFDEEKAAEEDALLRQQLERYNKGMRDFEEKQRVYRSGGVQAAAHLAHHHHHHPHPHHIGANGAAPGTVEGHPSHPDMEVRLRAY